MAFPSYLFTVCAIKAKNTYSFERFSEISYKADVPGRRDGLACEFSNFSYRSKSLVTLDRKLQ